ncbi:MAG: UDP-N-acetylmuramate dehydrogenase [Oscillospiraceae bacterium]|nr:UDP-N-acetylmuramate dehydrogenase [Oscillospiraceae bacterium]
MTNCIAQLQARGVAVAQDVPLSGKTSFKIGGLAEWMLFPATVEELQLCVRLCAQAEVRPFLLGNGSNLLVKDSGLDGVVIATEKLQDLRAAGDGRILCEAGVKLAELCVFAQKQGLAGLEFAYGIPGSAGGAVFMNAGAYGGEMQDVLTAAAYVDAQGELRTLASPALGLGYRRSAFMANGGLVASLTVQLTPGDPAEIRARMEEIMRRRKEKQPLEFPSAGSVFKRPEGQFAGALIEKCGLKGQQIGGAQVSEKHAGFIINRGGAKAADVRALIAVIQTVVQNQTGVLLEPEILFV